MSSPSEGSIYYSQSRGLWIAQIDLGHTPDGKRRRHRVTSKSRNTVIRKRRELIRQIEDNNFTPGRSPSTTAWMNHWLTTIAPTRIRPSTLTGYESITRTHINPNLGSRHLTKLTPADIRFMHTQMENAGVSQSTILKTHAILSKALKDAVREGLLPTNPCDRMDRPKNTAAPREAFSAAEVKALMITARGDGIAAYSRWLAALTIGARQAELLGLEWERVDLKTRTIDLSWQLQEIPWRHGQDCGCKGAAARACPSREPKARPEYEIRPCFEGRWFTRPKTSASIRLIPIPDPLFDALVELRSQSEQNPYGLVWVGAKGTPLRAGEDRAAWNDLCRRAGVRQLTLHSARHTMVSLLLDAGVDPEVIRQIAGHSTILSTRNYMHVSVEQARAALGLLSG